MGGLRKRKPDLKQGDSIFKLSHQRSLMEKTPDQRKLGTLTAKKKGS